LKKTPGKLGATVKMKTFTCAPRRRTVPSTAS